MQIGGGINLTVGGIAIQNNDECQISSYQVIKATSLIMMDTKRKYLAKKVFSMGKKGKTELVAITEFPETLSSTSNVQRRFRKAIILALVVTMLICIITEISAHTRWNQMRMREEALKCQYEISNWVLEQTSILNMFVNTISANTTLLEDYEGTVSFLDKVIQHYPRISTAYIANPYFKHGHSMVMNNGWIPASNYIVKDRKWYKGALTAPDYYITPPYYTARNGEYCISIAKVVTSDNGDFIGVFGIDYYLDALTNILTNSQIKDGYAFLVDKDGRIICHPYTEYQIQNGTFTNISKLPYMKALLSKEAEIIQDYDGKRKVCMVIHDDYAGFELFVVKDFWSIYGDAGRYLLMYLLLFGGVTTLVVMTINRMIHWQQRTEDQLREAAQEAQKADQIKSEFLARMSHEIRTPLNTMQGMNELILRENKNEVIRSYAVSIKNAGNTLLSLINDILDLSKLHNGKLEIIPIEYSVSSLVNDLCNIISERARKKGLKFTTEIDPQLPNRLFGDDKRIRQVVINLLTNAVKYTETGTIKFTIKQVERNTDQVKLVVSVEDTGIGIREEDMKKLFAPFERVEDIHNRNIEGSGLGIPISNNILRQMNSQLQVESTYGKGSRFWFELSQKIINDNPIGDYEMRRKESMENKVSQSRIYAPEANVLVVDDNEMNLKVAVGLMAHNKIKADAVKSGQECLEAVKTKQYDIIFIDHMMPDMDGKETFDALKEANLLSKDTAVVMMTANAIVGARETYLAYGFADYISKPIAVDKLENLLIKHLPRNKIILIPPDKKNEQSVTVPVVVNSKFSTTSPTRFSFLDTKEGLSHCGNDWEFYLEIIRTYADGDKRKEMQHCFDTQDWEQYRILVHALKSTSLSIGANDLSKQAKELEVAARDENIAFIQSRHNDCMQKYSELLDKIHAEFSNLHTDTAQKAPEGHGRYHILVVDDEPIELKLAQRLLESHYDVDCVSSGPKAIEFLKTRRTDLILMDLRMPQMDGFEVLSRIKTFVDLQETPVVFLTADDDQNSELLGFQSGAIEFIRKPFQSAIMFQRINRILELIRLQKDLRAEVNRQTQRIARLSVQTVKTLVKTIEAKDKYTNGHSERVAKYSKEIARRAGLAQGEQNIIYFAGLLHDIGKIGVPAAIINKNSKLTDEEYAIIKTHPTIGAEILKDISELPEVVQGARWHHERFDGKGYPDGLSGNAIPRLARIISVADAYDAMTSLRSYRGVLSQAIVRKELEKGLGTQWDEQFGRIMIEMMDEDVDYQMREHSDNE